MLIIHLTDAYRFKHAANDFRPPPDRCSGCCCIDSNPGWSFNFCELDFTQGMSRRRVENLTGLHSHARWRVKTGLFVSTGAYINHTRGSICIATYVSIQEPRIDREAVFVRASSSFLHPHLYATEFTDALSGVLHPFVYTARQEYSRVINNKWVLLINGCNVRIIWNLIGFASTCCDHMNNRCSCIYFFKDKLHILDLRKQR